MKINKICSAIDLKCEGRSHALGIDEKTPSFSWQFSQEGENTIQTAYQITVSSKKNCRNGDMWDTGMVSSARTNMIEYEGKELEPETEYYWTVRVWDKDSIPSQESEIACFETAKFSKAWNAEWLTGGNILRKEFVLPSDIKTARAYITCVGYYELYINGKKIGDEVLAPSYTDPELVIEYHVYDITEYLHEGTNAAAIMLGHGMPIEEPYLVEEPLAIAEIKIKTDSGTEICLGTDETWNITDSPILENSLYRGETYDAQLEDSGWDKPGFTGKVSPAVLAEPPAGMLVAVITPSMKVVDDTMAVKSIARLENGDRVVDVGQNMTGWLSFSLKGQKGSTIVLRYAELLYDDGTVNQENLRSADAVDKYIFKGEGVETYSPHFTTHGFRYVQISEYTGEITPEDLKVCVVRSSVAKAGEFECSDEFINRVHSAMKWTFANNMQSVPTDCPQRAERRGWLCDAHVASEGCIMNFDMQYFYRKWLLDIDTLINDETGEILYANAPRWVIRESMEYKSAFLIVTWNLYKHYGDLPILKKNYRKMKLMMQFLMDQYLREDGYLDLPETFGDWLSVEATDKQMLGNAYYLISLDVLVNSARVLCNKDDEKHYAELLRRGKAAYHKVFYSPRITADSPEYTGYYGQLTGITQCAQTFPIYLDLCDPAELSKVERNLIWDIEKAHGDAQLTTGIASTKYVVEVLHKLNRDDLVLKLFRRKLFPSWGFMLEMGGTTVWERWQYLVGGEMNSHDHPALAAPDTWLFTTLAGINSEFDENGRRVFTISPYIDGSIGWVKVSRDTAWGHIAVSLTTDNGKKLNVSVPPNTSAHIICSDIDEWVGSGDYLFEIQA